MATTVEQLMAISPIDGRYAERMGELPVYSSEFGLIKFRVQVMSGWLGMLGSGILPDREPLSDQAQTHLEILPALLDTEAGLEVKGIEAANNHDVKAAEVWLTGQLDDPMFDEYRTMVHFGCTSEDVNSAAYALMIREIRSRVVLPLLEDIDDDLLEKSGEWAELAMLSLTHGQPATPTTLGKEMRVMEERLRRQIDFIKEVGLHAKFSGASGGYNAATFAYPEVDWPEVSRRFIVEQLKLGYTPVTGQIEPHDYIARFSNDLHLANTILSDLSKDMWLYISRGVIRQRPKEGETGSSTMPHKVNPIDFENAEGNFDMAGATLQKLASSLPISRMQRDLSDSTRLRTLGPAVAHSAVGYASVKKGLSKIYPNEKVLAGELNNNWAVLTEAVQTIMRRYKIEGAYERVKAVSRGFDIDEQSYHALIEDLKGELPAAAYDRLQSLTPATYLGKSVELAYGE